MDDYKVRKYSRLTYCSICEKQSGVLISAQVMHTDTTEIRSRKKHHVQFVERERFLYCTERNVTTLDSNRYSSIIVDGADQFTFGVPPFAKKTKEVRQNCLKVCLDEFLDPGKPNRLSPYALKEKHNKAQITWLKEHIGLQSEDLKLIIFH